MICKDDLVKRTAQKLEMSEETVGMIIYDMWARVRYLLHNPQECGKGVTLHSRLRFEFAYWAVIKEIGRGKTDPRTIDRVMQTIDNIERLHPERIPKREKYFVR